MPSLESITFLLTFVGPAFVVLPTFTPIERVLTDTQTIDLLEEARTELLRFRPINRSEDAHFTPAIDAIKKHADEEDFGEVHGLYSGDFRQFGGGGSVFLLDEDQAGESNPFLGQDSRPTRLESILIVDEWLNEEINEKRTKCPHRVRYIGFVLLFVAFLLQVIGPILI